MRKPAFWNLKKAEDGRSAELRIDGDIVDDTTAWFYKWFGDPCTSPGSVRAELDGLGDIPLTVWIDSYGGDVVAASAIYTALMEYKGPLTAKIDGAAYSAASVIAMACETVLMSPTATMMVHLPWTHAEGNAHDMRHTADVLDQVGETLLNAYQAKTMRTRDELLAMLTEETWMSPQKAIALGFADGMLYEWDSEAAQNAIVAKAQGIYAMARKQGDDSKGDGDWIVEAEARLLLEQKRT